MPKAERKSATFKQMTRGAYFYQAPIPAGGFVWRNEVELIPRERPYSALAKTGPWLVGPSREGLKVPEASALNSEKGDPGIHREIACLWSPESIADFASKYGHLLPSDDLLVIEPDSITDLDGGRVYSEWWGFAESLAQWQAEITELRTLLHFWDLVQEGAEKRLARFVVWRPQSAVLRWKDTPSGPAPAPNRERSPNDTRQEDLLPQPYRAQLLGLWGSSKVIEPVRYYIHGRVNEGLKGVAPRILPYVSPPHRITFFPNSLLSAAYVLFALELAGETETALCKNDKCPKPGRRFTQQTRRQDFCSDYCRKAKWERDNASRNRKEVTNGQA